MRVFRVYQLPLLLLLAIATITSVNAQDFNTQVKMRVYEKIDRFLASAVDTLKVWADFYELGGFPNGMKAADRTLARQYLYSVIAALNDVGLKPFYGLEDGTLMGYWHGDLNQVPLLAYREPGNSGYEVPTTSSTEGLAKYFDVCLDATNGQQINCTMESGRPLYTSCINDCELIPCAGDASALCPNYEILQLSANDNFGYVPSTFNCINADGDLSQTPGEVLVETADGVNPNGDCTFDDGTLVSRELAGPFAACGLSADNVTNNVCSTTFIGAAEYVNYDPRWRGWYIDCKAALVPRFSDPYVFFNFGALGITYTHPVFMESGSQKIFHGVLAADMELSDVSNFLKTAFVDTNYTIAVYEYEDPYYIIATSTNATAMGTVLVDNPLERCPEGQEDNTDLCKGGRMTINNIEESIDDIVLRKAHNAVISKKEGEELVAVQADEDDAASTTFLATSLVYELPGANLKWRIVVTSPMAENPQDFILEDDGMYAVLAVVGVLGFLLCFFLFLAFYRRKNEKAIQFADFHFTSAFILGAAAINLSVFTYLGKPDDQMCLNRYWAFFMLTTIGLAPLFVKAYRIYRLLGSSVAKAMNAKINNREAWMRTLPMITIQVIILLIATFVDPPRVMAEVDLDDANPQKRVACNSDTNLFGIMQGSFDIILLIVGCTLAYLTRNIDPRFGDAKAIFFAMYNIAFTTLMLALIIIFVDISEAGKVSLRFIGVFWATVFSSAAFVLPRLMAAKNDRKQTQKMKRRLQSRLESQRQSRADSSAVVASAYDEEALHETEEALKILVCTANMGNAPPTLESMKAWIPESGSSYEVTPFEESLVVKDNYDLIVIGMQEATWGSKKHRKAQKKQKEGVEDAEESSLHNSQTSLRGLPVDDDELSLEEAQAKEDNYLAAIEGADTVFLRKLMKDILGADYTSMAMENRGQMRLFVWARSSIAPLIKEVKVSGENTGIGGVLANKGGIVVSMDYGDTRMTFISAHLAAHEGDNYYKARCENVAEILKGSRTFELCKKNQIDLALSSHHIFVCGDLNFRTKFDGELSHEEKFAMAQELIKAQDWKGLYSYDELHKGVDRNDLMVNFKTLPCDFHPTFKVNRKEGFSYKDQRIPSYTDRILFKSSPGISDNLKQYAYEPCEDFITSDHKPVRGAFSLITNDVIPSQPLEGKYRLTFSQMECADLPTADVSGTSDPYVKFIWDSVDMAEEHATINFKFWERGQSNFPKTPYKSKTLNPKWEGKTIVLVTTGFELKLEAQLLLAVYDYDFLADDDILGTLPLSLPQLVSMKPRESSKELFFDRPLERYGKYTGRIKFKLEVEQLVG